MNETNPAAERRVILRRSRGRMGAGTSTRSESLRSSSVDEHEPDEVDDAIDPDQVSRRIRTGQFPSPALPSPADAGEGRENPRSRLNAVQMAGSASYAKEYRLQLLHRLLMRNIPLDQIASQLQVSISTVEKDRAELKRRLRDAATQMNIDEMIGHQQALYDEVSGMALRIASQGNRTDENGNPVSAVPTPMRLAAMRTALAANADRTRFLNTAGVFDVLRFRRAEDGGNVSDVQQLMLQTLELMESLKQEDSPQDRPSRSGGFAPMTFDDADATGSANEVEHL